ncbi:sodium channel subunit beta-3 isoform X2 [Notolabrus celidotus]|uniref:sodium channel subunit beta-3 isoform X2 n=1 Tax=Notolabrus celidotus TaxID=1203425 RepID=UPI0014904B69|nr:sodium channel subunit beta-3 isoform X2 [Notolabrus celidotus]
MKLVLCKSTINFHPSQPVCVDVPSGTEAVLGKSMKLSCIACMKREEIKAKTRVDWYYMPNQENYMPFEKTHIYKYEDDTPKALDGPFKGRLFWNGSQDLQDVSIMIINVTYNDSGVYECHVFREYEFESFTPSVFLIKDIKLKVKQQASRDTTALYSEIMMYVLLVFLTLWLVVEMVYCYRKISKSDEQVQDTAKHQTGQFRRNQEAERAAQKQG